MNEQDRKDRALRTLATVYALVGAMTVVWMTVIGTITGNRVLTVPISAVAGVATGLSLGVIGYTTGQIRERNRRRGGSTPR